jgi:hypothetical protein
MSDERVGLLSVHGAIPFNKFTSAGTSTINSLEILTKSGAFVSATDSEDIDITADVSADLTHPSFG